MRAVTTLVAALAVVLLLRRQENVGIVKLADMSICAIARGTMWMRACPIRTTRTRTWCSSVVYTANRNLVRGDVDSSEYDAENDANTGVVCGAVDSCEYDAENDADADVVCGAVDS
jgi:hypothetical protein